MGENWFDGKVWEANNLKYKEHSGNWKRIFTMIESGLEYDYFSRGLNEIIGESYTYPELAIERNLALIYDRDYFFYLSNTGRNKGAEYQDVIESALTKAKESGLIERLVRKYWADDFNDLNYDKRIQLHLITPK